MGIRRRTGRNLEENVCGENERFLQDAEVEEFLDMRQTLRTPRRESTKRKDLLTKDGREPRVILAGEVEIRPHAENRCSRQSA